MLILGKCIGVLDVLCMHGRRVLQLGVGGGAAGEEAGEGRTVVLKRVDGLLPVDVLLRGNPKIDQGNSLQGNMLGHFLFQKLYPLRWYQPTVCTNTYGTLGKSAYFSLILSVYNLNA